MNEYYNPDTGVRGPRESNSMVMVGCLVFLLILVFLALGVVVALVLL